MRTAMNMHVLVSREEQYHKEKGQYAGTFADLQPPVEMHCNSQGGTVVTMDIAIRSKYRDRVTNFGPGQINGVNPDTAPFTPTRRASGTHLNTGSPTRVISRNPVRDPQRDSARETGTDTRVPNPARRNCSHILNVDAGFRPSFAP